MTIRQIIDALSTPSSSPAGEVGVDEPMEVDSVNATTTCASESGRS